MIRITPCHFLSSLSVQFCASTSYNRGLRCGANSIGRLSLGVSDSKPRTIQRKNACVKPQAPQLQLFICFSLFDYRRDLDFIVYTLYTWFSPGERSWRAFNKKTLKIQYFNSCPTPSTLFLDGCTSFLRLSAGFFVHVNEDHNVSSFSEVHFG